MYTQFSGELTEDTTWSGAVSVTGDITVPDGITLTINAGDSRNLRRPVR